MVEQRIENPCVPGSIPGGTTSRLFSFIVFGTIAQLVEQRIENPCVPGSIPGGTTQNTKESLKTTVFKDFFMVWKIRENATEAVF